MNFALSQPRKSTLVLLIVVAAFCVWMPRQLKLVHARQALSAARTQLSALRDRFAAATDSLDSAQQELRAENDRHNQAVADVAKAGQLLAKIDPESRWTAPPSSLPEWNAESPYVWLRKEMVPRLPVSVFTEDGELRGEVAYVLDVDPSLRRSLNEQLKGLLAEYRALEVAKAERSDEHLPGMAGQSGEKLTIRVQPLPEEGARIRQQFEGALIEALGEQRAQLLMQAGENWIGSQFAQFGSEPKIISVIRHPDGSLNVSIKTGPNWISTGGPAAMMKDQIPPHLRPLFSELFDHADPAGPAKGS